MNYRDILSLASQELLALKDKEVAVLEINKPPDIQFAKNLAKIISKLSPFVGNMIELSIVNILNNLNWQGLGYWIRQDPGFPDTLFDGSVEPKPGIEIKTWFPLATEITARFKDSILRFQEDQTNVVVIAWLPEYIIYGKPKIIDVWIGSAKSLAMARDRHYHRPPDYLVFEPEDTTLRTSNLQQTNTNGYKFQGDAAQLKEAEAEVGGWGNVGKVYQPTADYQSRLKSLLGKYPYRLDTNFAKIDRIRHEGLEAFKLRVLNMEVNRHTIQDWARLISSDEVKILL